MPGRRSLSRFGRLHQVFRRYAARHLTLSGAGCDLSEATGGAVPGVLDPVVLDQGRLVLSGRAEAELVSVRIGPARHETRPVVTSGKTGAGQFGFDLPFAPAPLHLEFTRGGVGYGVHLPGFRRWRVQLATFALWPRFGATLFRTLPDLWRWRRHGDFGAREAVKTALGLSAQIPAQPLDSRLFEPAGTPAPKAGGDGVTIILPVFNAFELLEEALGRVARHTDLPWRLILIEDASTDPRVRPFLRDWAGRNGQGGQIELIENSQNLGFIASVNTGFARALEGCGGEGPVIVLNSDAFVPEGWASRLIGPLLEDRTVASVTPMSNDAEIFSAPVICRASGLDPGEGDRLDAIARRFHPGAALAEAPTGVGFCMAMSRAFLAQVPHFDTAFGRGYGEETDWCQKTRALGGRHLGLAGLFVEHRGAGSFGTAEKRRRMVDSAAVIARRYPDYDRQVQEFIRRDPMTTARLALAVAWAAARQDGRMPLYLAHAMGGGAEKYLERRVAKDIAAGGAALVLRVGQMHRWRLEVHGADGITQGVCDDFTLIERILEPVNARRVVYNCGAGDRDPAALPGMLRKLASGDEDRIEVLIHDYLPLSPSYTLLDADGLYRGLPKTGNCDPAHVFQRADGTTVSLTEWRAAWCGLMVAADEVTVFSEASRALVTQACPGAAAVRVRPHLPLSDISRVAPPEPGARPVIGVLGNVGYQKGAAVLSGLSRLLAGDRRADLVVIGNLDPGYRLAPPAIVHGNYRHADIPALVARYGITGWVIPSVWPETFSFATREALATGLPVWCFDLGAQAEAVRAALETGGQGGVVPLTDGQGDPARLLEDVLRFWEGRARK
ncbi:Glycosyltransferase, GT2 family [Salinihabitans flavidus]|uniref:Glycosyltransferase, GT2 family n=2 Tax=Salinihabitans flavidus TaxID=569882 RepID=A0A1H8V1P1_9RHOB|nr:Glycosyltransferase, GT2 family [Salinihabitans flavidus]